MIPQSARTNSRLLAVDLRPRRFGYAVIESPARLVDFGVTRSDSPPVGARRVAILIAKYRPNVLVLRKIGRGSTRNRPVTRTGMRLITREARKASLEVATLSNRQVSITLNGSRNVTKYEIASLLTWTFPELAWRLPPPRKPWQPERWNMLIFDAAALGISYLVQQNDESLIHKLAFAD